MELHACLIGDTPPEDSTPVYGKFKLQTDEEVTIHRVDPESKLYKEELEKLNEQCQELAATLGYFDLFKNYQLYRLDGQEEEAAKRERELLDKLHTYNEVKDFAQALIGQLAVLEGCTTKELYPRYGLELDD